MSFADRVSDAGRSAAAALWRARTVGRVALQTGMHSAVRPSGLRAVAWEMARGRATPSLLFRYHAANEPHRAALIEPCSLTPRAPGEPEREDRIWSFFELDDRMERLARALTSRGIRRGDAVLLVLKNRPEFILLQPALGRIGCAAVSVSFRSSAPELEYIAKHSGARALFFDADVAPLVGEALPRLGIPAEACFVVGGEAAGFETIEALVSSAGAGPFADAEVKDHGDEAAVVMYTSGTTGKPKGAVRRFPRGAIASALALLGETPMRVGEKHLVVCPLYHATAFGFVSLTYLLAGQVVVLPEFRPELFLQAVERYQITTTALVPTMLHRILELGPAQLARHDLRSLKAIFCGGAPLGAELARRAMDALGDVVYNFYGATETGVVTLAGPADLRASPGTIGRPIPGNTLRLLDDVGREVAEGDVGELFVESAMLVDGYHRDETATRESMRGAFFSVGDLARRDARGCYHLAGRKRDLVISGGVNVYPAEVESALSSHPDVVEAAVVGVPDVEWGERVRAFVVLRSGAEAGETELRAHCKQRLAGPKVPRDFVFLSELPRNPTGKVLKRELREA